ncbi:MAG: squalene synthase HpnC [Ignavibacteriae bacterium]|nr:squalene synthase HpnC [Ignavibacteriota bacterium]
MIDYKSINVLELVKPDGGKYSVSSIEDAFEFCRQITVSHYENFPVSSFLIPKYLRKYVYSIYAYSRIADDIGDELSSIGKEEQLKSLDDYENLLLNRTIQKKGNPVFLALHNTMNETEIPSEPLQKLLTAFRMDINFNQSKTFQELENYCFYSANPIGELILRLFKNYNDRTAYFSDKICTGLQIANFWQDLSVDLKQDRVYIPSDILLKYKLNIDDLKNNKKTENLISCLNELYLHSESYLNEGFELVKYLNNYRFRLEIKATVNGGLSIIKKCRSLNYNILYIRPELSKLDFFKIFMRLIFNSK